MKPKVPSVDDGTNPFIDSPGDANNPFVDDMDKERAMAIKVKMVILCNVYHMSQKKGALKNIGQFGAL